MDVLGSLVYREDREIAGHCLLPRGPKQENR